MDETEIPFTTQTNIYAVYDKLAHELVGNIFTTQHDAAAIRAFSEALQNPNSLIAKHPKDFQLISFGRLICTDNGPSISPLIDNGVFTFRVVTTGEAWVASQPLKLEA